MKQFSGADRIGHKMIKLRTKYDDNKTFAWKSTSLFWENRVFVYTDPSLSIFLVIPNWITAYTNSAR